MGKLRLETQISIVGYIAEVNGNTDWMLWNRGPVWTWDSEWQKYHVWKNQDSGIGTPAINTVNFG
jgi:hypothetical protein